jgi:hypothetical protein
MEDISYEHLIKKSNLLQSDIELIIRFESRKFAFENVFKNFNFPFINLPDEITTTDGCNGGVNFSNKKGITFNNIKCFLNGRYKTNLETDSIKKIERDWSRFSFYVSDWNPRWNNFGAEAFKENHYNLLLLLNKEIFLQNYYIKNDYMDSWACWYKRQESNEMKENILLGIVVIREKFPTQLNYFKGGLLKNSEVNAVEETIRLMNEATIDNKLVRAPIYNLKMNLIFPKVKPY